MKQQKLSFVHHYTTYRDRIFTYLLYRVNFDRALAEDMTSDVFLKAYEHFGTFQTGRSFKSWIFTIAHNELVNYYRRRKPVIPLEEAQQVIAENGQPEFATDPQAALQEELDERKLNGQVMKLISKLPDMQKEVLTLRYLNQMSHAEIAEILNKNEGAVRVMCSRALDRLKQQFTLLHPEYRSTI